jgi:hypothetical protein
MGSDPERSLTTDPLGAGREAGGRAGGRAGAASQARAASGAPRACSGARARESVVSDTPLVATPLYGLRTWTVAGESGAERLAGPHQRVTWPPGGAWLEATCAQSPGHQPPIHGCGCGLHAWHPSRRSARRVLACRREIPGIAEASGGIEVHDDGFRAERARPYALVLAPGRNARLVRRLAEAYGAQVVEADRPAGRPGASRPDG